MGNIIPRKKVVPVEARRVEIPPAPVQTPSSVPPVSPNLTQNNYYVTVNHTIQPPPQPQPPAAPVAEPSPREVHYHTTHVYHSPMRPKLGKSASFLGATGVVLGGSAIGAAYVPQVVWLVQPLAVVGACLAGLALLNAMLFRRVYTGLPMLGLLVSAVAYGFYLKNSGQLPAKLPPIEFNVESKPVGK